MAKGSKRGKSSAAPKGAARSREDHSQSNVTPIHRVSDDDPALLGMPQKQIDRIKKSINVISRHHRLSKEEREKRLGPTRYILKISVDDVLERLSKIEASARADGSQSVADQLREFRAELGDTTQVKPEMQVANSEGAKVEQRDPLPDGRPALPTAAPEIYEGLRGPETPPEFVKRVYRPWLGQGLTRAHIRALDPTLYEAIRNWSRRNEWPVEVDLPTRSERASRWVDRVVAGDIPEEQLREARNLLAAKQRRDHKQHR